MCLASEALSRSFSPPIRKVISAESHDEAIKRIVVNGDDWLCDCSSEACKLSHPLQKDRKKLAARTSKGRISSTKNI